MFLLAYDVVFIHIPLFKGESTLPEEFVFFIISIDFMMLVMFVWLYRYSSRSLANACVLESHLSPSGLTIGWQGYMFLLVATIAIFLYLVFKVFGVLDISQVYLSNHTFYSQSKIGTSWLFYFLYAMVFVALYDSYLHGFTKFSMFIILLLILINAATGGRGHVITYLLLFFMIYTVVWDGKKIFFIGGLITVLIISSFAYNTLFRSGSTNVNEYLETSSSEADMNQAFAINDAIDYWYREGACYTCVIQDLSNLLLPRSIYPDKPISNAETREVYPEVAARGTTQTFGIYGGSILNIGLLSLLFVPVFYFLYVYFFAKALFNRKKSYLNFFLIYCGVNAVQFVRGGVLDARLIRLFITFLLAYFLYKLVLALFSKTRRIKLR